MEKVAFKGLLLSAVLIISGCTHWEKPGVSEWEMKRDLAACEYEAQKYGFVPYGNGVSPVSAGIQSGWQQGTLINQCMALKGYYKVKGESSRSQANNIERCNELRESKMYDESIVCYDQILQYNPESAVAYNQRGLAYSEIKNYEMAILNFNTAIEKASKDKNIYIAYVNRSEAKLGSKQYEGAIADATTAIFLKSDYARAYVVRADGYALSKQFDKALVEYDKILQKFTSDPNIHATYASKARCYLELKLYKEAIETTDKGLLAKSDFPAFYNIRGYSFIQLGQYQKALEEFLKAIGLDPSVSVNYNNKAYIYNKMKLYDKSIIECNKAISIDNTFPNTYKHRGLALYGVGKYEDALADINKAISIKPDYADAIYTRGLIFMALKNTSQTKIDMKKACELGNQDACNYKFEQ